MNYRRFLIINPYGIGDVLFTVPMIKNIRANVSNAFIGYIANRRTAPLLRNIPEVNHVTIYDRDEFKAVSERSKPEFLKLLFDTKNEIRDLEYDVCFDLSMTGYASFYCQLAGIKERVGLNYKNRSPFLTKKVPFPGYEGRYAAEYYLDLLRATGFKVAPQSMDVAIPVEKEAWAGEFLKKANLPTARFIVVFPGGGESWGQDAKFKRWPVEKYAELVGKMIEEFNVGVILMGNQREESLCKEIQSLVKWPLFNAAGTTDLLQTMVVLKKALYPSSMTAGLYIWPWPLVQKQFPFLARSMKRFMVRMRSRQASIGSSLAILLAGRVTVTFAVRRANISVV